MEFNSLELSTAIKSIIMASQLCEKIRKELSFIRSILKDDKSPVTVADYAVQTIICNIIKTTFPNDDIVAEENSLDLRKPQNLPMVEQVTNYVNHFIPNATFEEVCLWIDLSSHNTTERFWTLDPIDGTKGFLRGDQYAIALALIENGKVILGVLACPNLYLNKNDPNGERGCIFLALKEKGAMQMRIDGKRITPISVTKISDPREAIFAESFEPSHSDHSFHMLLANKLNIRHPSIKMDSQAKYGILARGEAAFYIRKPSKFQKEYKEKIWDHASGFIIAEEAGGKVTDLLGNHLDFTCGIELKKNYGILVSNGILHSTILNTLNEI